MRKYHDYDMYGHQPGCARCVGLRKEQHQKTCDAIDKRMTPKKSSALKIIYLIDGIKVEEDVIDIPKGKKFNPMSLAFRGQKMGYKIIDLINMGR